MSMDRGGNSLHGPGPVLWEVTPEKSFRGNCSGPVLQTWGAGDSSFILSPQLSIICYTQRRMCNLFYQCRLWHRGPRFYSFTAPTLPPSRWVIACMETSLYVLYMHAHRKWDSPKGEKSLTSGSDRRILQIYQQFDNIVWPEVKYSVKSIPPYFEISKSFEV